jgi:DNA-binding NtrC family response regulator
MNNKKKNVLIIEHEVIIALDLKKRFEDHGYNIIGTRSSLKDTLIILKNFKDVDLILLDSGINDFYQKINIAEKIYRNINVPVILLASYINDEIRSLCKRYSSIKLIEKPFRNEELMDVANDVLKHIN